jgi:hypothetical protein
MSVFEKYPFFLSLLYSFELFRKNDQRQEKYEAIAPATIFRLAHI